MRALRRLARWWPRPVETDADLDRAAAFLDVTPELLVRAGYGAAVWVLVAGGILSLVVGSPALAAAGVVSVPVASAPRMLARVLATARRNVALASAPDLVGYAVLRATLEPSPESAAAFAATAGSGPLATSLGAHVRRARGTADSGIEAFAAEWSEWLPGLGRAFALVAAAADAPPGERERTLERARRTAIDGVRARMTSFAGDLRGPATGLYAFGVLLPLALVAGLPAARAAGLGLSLPLVAVGYCLVLPSGLVAASVWLLARRPAAFPAAPVTRSHPDVPDGRWRLPILGALAAGFGWVLATALLPAWTRPVAALGAGAGVALLAWATPRVAVRERVRAMEFGIPDALALVGRRVGDGASVEAAVVGVADELDGATGDMLDGAADRQRRLGIPIEASLLGPRSVFATLPSERGRGAAAMLSVAAEEGAPAGAALVAMADHLDDLRRLEDETRRELRQVTGTLANTASVFGPLVAGAAVALAAGIGSRAPGTPLPVSGLGTVMGLYTLVLAALLAALSTGLERGVVPSQMGASAGRALVGATTTYLCAFVGAGALT